MEEKRYDTERYDSRRYDSTREKMREEEMSYHNERNEQFYERRGYSRYGDHSLREEDKIDLFFLMKDMLKGVRVLWWLPVLLAMAFFARVYYTFDYSYTPIYQTSTTVYVSLGNDESSYMNTLTAGQMEEVFPYLMDNGIIPDAILAKLGTDSYKGTISMTVDAMTNLATFTVTGSEPEGLYETAMTVEEILPDTIGFIVGDISFVHIKDMGEARFPINTPPTTIDAIKKSLRYAFYGFVLGCIIMCLYGLTIRTVSSRDDVKNLLNIDNLGSLPHIRARKRSNKDKNRLTVDNANIDYILGESIRMIRNRLERVAKKADCHSILITSSIPGEGKTTVAVNLALTLAMRGGRVLLIDGDMRNPSVSTLLNIDSDKKGLMEVLSGTEKVEDVMLKLTASGLYVLPAGSVTKKSADLLSSENMKLLLEKLSKHADYIIIDTPPVMVLGDSMAIGKYVDGCVYVVRRNHAHFSTIKDGFIQIAYSGCKILGSVYNDDTDGANGRYGHYGKYGKYGAYGYYGRKKGYGSYYGDTKK